MSPYKWARCLCQSLEERKDREEKKNRLNKIVAVEHFFETAEHVQVTYIFICFKQHTGIWVCVCVCLYVCIVAGLSCVQTCWHYREQSRVAVNITASPHEDWKAWLLNRKGPRTHTHILWWDVLTSSGGVKVVSGFEVSVGVKVENPEPVLQFGSQTVELWVSAAYTHTK